MLAHAMAQEAEIVKTSRNKYGDFIVTSSETITCRFRVITELDLIGNREEMRSDALMWVRPDEDIAENTIVYYDGEYYKVQRVVEARRLRGGTVEFKKCLMEKYTNIEEEESGS